MQFSPSLTRKAGIGYFANEGRLENLLTVLNFIYGVPQRVRPRNLNTNLFVGCTSCMQCIRSNRNNAMHGTRAHARRPAGQIATWEG